MNRSKLIGAFLMAAAALIVSPRPSAAQGAGPVCSASDAQCKANGAVEEGAPRWYSILRERTDAFCEFYMQKKADAALKGSPFTMPSPNNRFEVRVDGGHSYVYTDAEVQTLLRHCENYMNLLRKQWEADHPGQKAPY